MSLSLETESIGNAKRHKSPCTFQQLKTSDPKFYAELVEATLGDLPIAWVMEATAKRDKYVPESVLGRHRRNQCQQCKELHDSQ